MENALKRENSIKDVKSCNNIMIWGLLLRLAVLVFMLTVAMDFTEPYFIKDDIKYEKTVEGYMMNAASVFDTRQLSHISDEYIAPFWPWVSSILGYIFKWKYAGRVLNVILSVLTIKLVFNVTLNISENNKTALFAAKLMAFLPVTVLTCCFPIKDIFIMFATFYVFDFFLKLQKGSKLKPYEIIITVLLLVAIYYSRGAVMELLLLFFFAFYIVKYIKKKNYLVVLAIIALAAGVLYIYGDAIAASFTTKIEDYGGATGDGGVAALTVDSIMEIYKLPFAMFFANLQPIKMVFFTGSSMNWWYNFLTYANISVYPVAIANFMYIFGRKHNTMFWILSFAMYSAVISLSLGVFRHYLFLIPLQMINCALYLDEENVIKRNNKKYIMILGSMALLLYMLYYTVRKVF